MASSGKRIIKRSRAALRVDPDRLSEAARRDDETLIREAEADPMAAPVREPAAWRGAEVIEPEITVQVTLRLHRDTLRVFQEAGPAPERHMARVLDAFARKGDPGDR